MTLRRQERLQEMLREAGAVITCDKIPRISSSVISHSVLMADALATYTSLGGAPQEPSWRPGKWDIEASDIAIELDEELHLNRYRSRTLSSPVYERLSGFNVDDYFQFCRRHESDCLQASGRPGMWTNPSCEKQFGPAGPIRELSGHGAPRWKQRAFYDFLKDLASLVLGVRMARLSVWDTIRDETDEAILGDLLDEPTFPKRAWCTATWSLARTRISVRPSIEPPSAPTP